MGEMRSVLFLEIGGNPISGRSFDQCPTSVLGPLIFELEGTKSWTHGGVPATAIPKRLFWRQAQARTVHRALKV